MSEPDKTPENDPATPPDDFEFPELPGEPVSPAPEPSPAETPPPAPPPPPKPLSSWLAKHRSLALFLGFIVVAGAMWGLGKLRGDDDPESAPANTASNPDEVPVNAVEARLGRFQDIISAVGTLKGEAEIELRFQVEGRIEELNLVEGSRVKKGQILARISDRDAKLKVERARLTLEQTEKLFQLGGASPTKVKEERLNLDVALSELDKTRIIASRDGIIGEKEAEIGEFVNPQKKLAKLVSIKNVVVEVGIIEKDVDKVYPGQKMLVTVDAYPGQVFEGSIETISPMIGDDASKTFSIRTKIPNPDSLLLPGMFARTRIITYEADDAISVPNDALTKTPSGFQVFVVNKDNIAQARDVQVGYVAAEMTQIEQGLNPSEIVIVQKPPELKDGAKVRIIEIQK